MHYHYGSGEHGCLYDFGPYVARSKRAAAESIGCVFDLSTYKKRMLARDQYLDLDPHKDGASYAEIGGPCYCDEGEQELKGEEYEAA